MVGTGQWTVDGGQWTVDGGQWTVGRGRVSLALEFNFAKFDVFTKSKFREISAKFRKIRNLKLLPPYLVVIAYTPRTEIALFYGAQDNQKRRHGTHTCNANACKYSGHCLLLFVSSVVISSWFTVFSKGLHTLALYFRQTFFLTRIYDIFFLGLCRLDCLHCLVVRDGFMVSKIVDWTILCCCCDDDNIDLVRLQICHESSIYVHCAQ
jgi:hypothetical protein